MYQTSFLIVHDVVILFSRDARKIVCENPHQDTLVSSVLTPITHLSCRVDLHFNYYGKFILPFLSHLSLPLGICLAPDRAVTLSTTAFPCLPLAYWFSYYYITQLSFRPQFKPIVLPSLPPLSGPWLLARYVCMLDHFVSILLDDRL